MVIDLPRPSWEAISEYGGCGVGVKGAVGILSLSQVRRLGTGSTMEVSKRGRAPCHARTSPLVRGRRVGGECSGVWVGPGSAG